MDNKSYRPEHTHTVATQLRGLKRWAGMNFLVCADAWFGGVVKQGGRRSSWLMSGEL